MNFVMQLTNLLVEVEEKGEEGKGVVEVVASALVEEIPKYPHLEVVVHNLVKVKGVSLRIRANL